MAFLYEKIISITRCCPATCPRGLRRADSGNRSVAEVGDSGTEQTGSSMVALTPGSLMCYGIQTVMCWCCFVEASGMMIFKGSV